MNVFLITLGAFCVLHIAPAPPLLDPPIAQWLELEVKENQGGSVYEEPERLAERIQALAKAIQAGKKRLGLEVKENQGGSVYEEPERLAERIQALAKAIQAGKKRYWKLADLVCQFYGSDTEICYLAKDYAERLE